MQRDAPEAVFLAWFKGMVIDPRDGFAPPDAGGDSYSAPLVLLTGRSSDHFPESGSGRSLFRSGL